MKKVTKPAKSASKPTTKSAAKPKAKPATKATAKTAAKPAATAKAPSAKPVIVGKLTDWPLGARLAKLLDLPASVTELGCVQVLGGHGPAVLELLGAETKSSADVERAKAALDACTKNGAAIVKSTQLVHPSLSPEEVASCLGTTFRVMSPAEALAGRKKTPAQSLKWIEKNLAELDGLGVPRKTFLAWLDGKGKIESVLRANADTLSRAMASEPEAYNELDEQLFALWVQRLHRHANFPWPHPDDLEYGSDRRTAYLDKMVAAGMDRAAAEDWMLGTWSQRVRTWPSTGIWVWEALVADARALSTRVLGLEDGARHLRFVLGAVLELPKSTLEAGALDVVKKVCADKSLVPDETMERLLADSDYRALLGTIAR